MIKAFEQRLKIEHEFDESSRGQQKGSSQKSKGSRNFTKLRPNVENDWIKNLQDELNRKGFGGGNKSQNSHQQYYNSMNNSASASTTSEMIKGIF